MNYWYFLIPVLVVIGAATSYSERSRFDERRACILRGRDFKPSNFRSNRAQNINENFDDGLHSNRNRNGVYSVPNREKYESRFQKNQRDAKNRLISRNINKSFRERNVLSEHRIYKLANLQTGSRLVLEHGASSDNNERIEGNYRESNFANHRTNARFVFLEADKFDKRDFSEHNKVKPSTKNVLLPSPLGEKRDNIGQSESTDRAVDARRITVGLQISRSRLEGKFFENKAKVIRDDSRKTRKPNSISFRNLNDLQRRSSRQTVKDSIENPKSYEQMARLQSESDRERSLRVFYRTADEESKIRRMGTTATTLRYRGEVATRRNTYSSLHNSFSITRRNAPEYSENRVRTDVTREIPKSRLFESINTRRENRIVQISGNRKDFHDRADFIKTESDRKLPEEFTRRITTRILRSNANKNEAFSSRREGRETNMLYRPENTNNMVDTNKKSRQSRKNVQQFEITSRNYGFKKFHRNTKAPSFHNINTVNVERTDSGSSLKAVTQFIGESTDWKVLSFYSLQGVYLVSLLLNVITRNKKASKEDMSIFKFLVNRGAKTVKVD